MVGTGGAGGGRQQRREPRESGGRWGQINPAGRWWQEKGRKVGRAGGKSGTVVKNHIQSKAGRAGGKAGRCVW